MITISYRAIKIAAIFIAVLFFAMTAIPAGSQQTVREGISLELPGPQEMFPAPFKTTVADINLTLFVDTILVLGIHQVGENRYAWATVEEFLPDPDMLPPHDDPWWIRKILYLPGPQMLSLFETAIPTLGLMAVEVHAIEAPEDWDVGEGFTLYKVTSAAIYPAWEVTHPRR